MGSHQNGDFSVPIPGPDESDFGNLPELLNQYVNGEISWGEHTELANAEVARVNDEILSNLDADFKAGSLSRESYEWERKIVLLNKSFGLGEISSEEYQRRFDALME